MPLTTDNTMLYMQNLEARPGLLLSGILEGGQAIIIREMKQIVLESYRNGQKAGAPKATRPARRPALVASR